MLTMSDGNTLPASSNRPSQAPPVDSAGARAYLVLIPARAFFGLRRVEDAMPVLKEQLDAAFSPKVVAVVGARKFDNYVWLRNMSDFKGTLYSVQINPDDIVGIEEMGIPNFKSLVEIPEPVDYVVVAVPRRAVPFVLKDAVEKGVKTMHMFTSGFAESGHEEAIQMQQQIAETAREAGILVIGPNCMGVFNPHVGMRFGEGQNVDYIGGASVISQSGAHASAMTQGLQASGVGVNVTVSFGNAILLDSPDLLRYFADDPATNVICAYIEGPKDGQSFFPRAAGRCAEEAGRAVEGRSDRRGPPERRLAHRIAGRLHRDMERGRSSGRRNPRRLAPGSHRRCQDADVPWAGDGRPRRHHWRQRRAVGLHERRVLVGRPARAHAVGTHA